MSILSGYGIKDAVREGRIHITPFDELLVNPASYDLRLGDLVIEYRDVAEFDCKAELPPGEKWQLSDKGGMLLPGRLYLMHTAEYIRTTNYVPVLDGKSSLGRIGVQVHLTAGYGDPGFDGQYTLEVLVVYPVRVYAGMRFCQMRFHEISGALEHYRGNYTGEHSRGPVPSRVRKQF